MHIFRRLQLASIAIALLLGASASDAVAQAKNAPAIPPPAWQGNDAALAAKYEQLTGKYIYHVACTPCHAWGPDYWPREKWEVYLKDFPANHEPDVRKLYADLAATMDVGKSMPSRQQQRDSLASFILAAAPGKELPQAVRERPFRPFPEVGQAAPDFSIADIEGREIKLAEFKDKRALVLIFSRAHW
jgi:hypothetical protein